jgi:hypothetical protein
MIFLLRQQQETSDGKVRATLFGSLLACVYHCLDRIVILGHIQLLTRPENIVHFFSDLHQSGAITKGVLRKRTDKYNCWVGSFPGKRRIPVEWAEHGVRKEHYVRATSAADGMAEPVRSLLHSQEHGSPTDLPLQCAEVARQRSRLPHHQSPAPLVYTITTSVFATKRPLQITYYPNGYRFIERELIAERCIPRGESIARHNEALHGIVRIGRLVDYYDR